MRRIALLLAAALLPACENAQETPRDAKAPAAKTNAAPPLAADAWFGSEPLTLEGLKGKVVVVDFWNTTCGPCRKLMPHLAEMYAKHKAEGLVVMGISEDEKADLEEFLKANPVAYPLAIDQFKGGTGVTFDAYGIRSIPTACLIARDGALVWKGPGEELTNQMVLAELSKK
ncbi:MAG TPA: TlpA disulfide reductase family protein [Planctomycetota bacterium]|nr:TlpA disulfide reductase family protein [Planctomycetota bacterium]